MAIPTHSNTTSTAASDHPHDNAPSTTTSTTTIAPSTPNTNKVSHEKDEGDEGDDGFVLVGDVEISPPSTCCSTILIQKNEKTGPNDFVSHTEKVQEQEESSLEDVMEEEEEEANQDQHSPEGCGDEEAVVVTTSVSADELNQESDSVFSNTKDNGSISITSTEKDLVSTPSPPTMKKRPSPTQEVVESSHPTFKQKMASDYKVDDSTATIEKVESHTNNTSTRLGAGNNANDGNKTFPAVDN